MHCGVPDLPRQVLATDSCSGYTYTQTPTAGTSVGVGVANVTVTVTDNFGNAVSNTVALTVLDSSPAPTVMYVHASYNNLPAGTAVTFPYVGGSGTHYIGCDAFGKVQAGINRVASGGTVNVAAGIYTEELTISQPLKLSVLNATNNPNTGSRLPEAIIQPDISNPDIYNDPNIYGNGGIAQIEIATNGVTIEGFTIDGYNTNLTGAFTSGTNSFNAPGRPALPATWALVPPELKIISSKMTRYGRRGY